MNYQTLEADVNAWCNSAYWQGRAGHSIFGVTWHHQAVVGGMDPYALASMWDRNDNASAHYSIDKNGVVAQHIYDADTAWHTGTSRGNRGTIGIECANSGANPWTVYDATIESLAKLTAGILIRYNLGYPEWLINVFPHNYWVSTQCPGELAHSQWQQAWDRTCYWYEQMANGNYATTSTDGWHDGWNISQKSPDYQCYRYSDGTWAYGWRFIDGTWYYFDDAGYVVYGWKALKTSSDGVWRWWYFSPVHDGTFGAMLTGWQKIGDSWYYLEPDDGPLQGSMVEGLRDIDGETYFFTPNQGSMVTGWYHDKTEDRDNWFFFDDAGHMVKNRVITVTTDGKTSAFAEDGKMIEGTATITTDENGYITDVKHV